MSFNTDWDVDKYKTEYESDEHWGLRRSFMETHKNKFPEERLVCLAQVFTNVEFLGCRYPTKTMELVAELSEGVADAYRERQKTKLQRTFVKASDAAGAKVKGLKRPALAGPLVSPPKIRKCTDNILLPQNVVPSLDDKMTSTSNNSSNILAKPPTNISNDNSSSKSTQDIKKYAFVRATEIPEVENEEEEGEEREEGEKQHKVNKVNGCEGNSFVKPFLEDEQNSGETDARINRRAARKQQKGISRAESYRDLDSEIEMVIGGKYGRLILIEHTQFGGPYQILLDSTTCCKIPFHLEYGDDKNNQMKTSCKILVNDHVVVSVSDASKRIARDVAASCALEKLKDVCYTLKVKKCRVPEELVVEHTMISSIVPSSAIDHHAPVPKAATLATPLPEDNIGSKLMRSMGWTGGGLGKAEQGIQEPVSVSLRIDRAGLGAQKRRADATFKAKARIYLLRYLTQDFPPNLLLKADAFSASEREAVRQIAKELGLQSIIIGRSDYGYLIIARKDSAQLIAAQMLRHDVLSDEYHELVRPQNPSSMNSEPECLQASDFPHLCHQRDSSRVSLTDSEKSGPKQSESYVMGGHFRGVMKSFRRVCREQRRREKKKEKSLKRQIERFRDKQDPNQTAKQYSLEAIAAGPYGSFFLIEYENAYDSELAIMNESARNNFVPIQYQYGSFKAGAFCKVYVNNHLLTTTSGFNKKDARDFAVKEAYEKLKQICYTLKIKLKINSDGTVVDKDLGKGDSQEQSLNNFSGTSGENNGSGGDVGEAGRKNTTGNSLNQPLDENIGSKLMRAMGWTGGGLGKEEQGRKEPVSILQRVKREGFGVKETRKFREHIFKLLKNYIEGDSPYDLVFTSEFSKEERAVMHNVAQKLHLKSKSYGKHHSRSLVISRKKDFCQIVENMLRSGEYSNSTYELIKPAISLPPETQSQSEPENIMKSENETVSPIKSLNPSPNVSDDLPVLKNIAPEIIDVSPRNKGDGTSGKNSVFMSGTFSVEDIGNSHSPKPGYRDLISGPFGRLVLIEDSTVKSNIQLIERSANGCHIPFKFDYANVRGGMVCKLLVNNIMVASHTEINKKRAREGAVSKGIEKLKEVCFTLKSQIKMGDDKITVFRILKKPFKRPKECEGDAENIVCISKDVDWAFLGVAHGINGVSQNIFKDKARSFLRRYLAEECPFDLVLCPVFSAENRSIVQKLASGLALKTSLYELSKQDFLVISKKLSPLELAEAMLRSGGNALSDSITPGTFVCL